MNDQVAVRVRNGIADFTQQLQDDQPVVAPRLKGPKSGLSLRTESSECQTDVNCEDSPPRGRRVIFFVSWISTRSVSRPGSMRQMRNNPGCRLQHSALFFADNGHLANRYCPDLPSVAGFDVDSKKKTTV